MTELEEIYEHYFKDVYLFVYSLSKDRHLSEDITSETFLKAIKSIDQFKGESDIKIWLFQIAKHTYYSYLRKQKKETTTELLEEVKADVDIVRMISSSEEWMNVHKVLHELSDPYKEVFTLRIFGELSFKQIGKLFGKTDNWACVTFYRAKSKIREEMGKYQ